MTEHQFQMQEEQLNGGIRQEKINQKQADLLAEKEVTKQAQQQVKTQEYKTLESKEDTNIARIKVDGKRRDATLLTYQNARKSIDIANSSRENSLYGKTLDLKYQGLETGYEEAKKMLENRRELLKEKGII